MAKILFNDKEYNANVFDYSLLAATPTINGSRVEGSKTSEELNAVWIGTQAEYEALAHRYSTCTYVITDDPYAVLNTNAAEVMRSASARFDGDSGLVPAPKAGDQSKVLVGSGAYITIPFKEFSGATEQYAGEKGLVPAPVHGEEAATLGGDGVWHKMPRVNGSREWDDNTTYYVAEEPGNLNDILVSEGTNTPVWKTKEDAVQRMKYSTDTEAGEAGAVYAPTYISDKTQHLGDQGWTVDSPDKPMHCFYNDMTNYVTEEAMEAGMPYINGTKNYTASTNLIVPTVQGIDKYAWSFATDTMAGKWIKQNSDDKLFSEYENGYIPKKLANNNKLLFSDGSFVGYKDSTAVAALDPTVSDYITERIVYNGLPKINNVHTFKSSTRYYSVPTTKGSVGEYLTSGDNGQPVWKEAVDSTTPEPIETNDKLITEEDIKNSLPAFNNVTEYSSDTKFYGLATNIGNENDLLVSLGDNTSDWRNIGIIEPYTAATEKSNGKNGVVPAPLQGQQDYALGSVTGTWTTLEYKDPYKVCTASTDGEKGAVPAPIAGEQTRILTGGYNWGTDSSDAIVPTSLSDDAFLPTERKLAYGIPTINNAYGGSYYWNMNKPGAGQHIESNEKGLPIWTESIKELVVTPTKDVSYYDDVYRWNIIGRLNVRGTSCPNSDNGEVRMSVKGDDLKYHNVRMYPMIYSNFTLKNEELMYFDELWKNDIWTGHAYTLIAKVHWSKFYRLGYTEDGRKVYFLGMKIRIPMMLTGTSCVTCYNNKRAWREWENNKFFYMKGIDDCNNFEIIEGTFANTQSWGSAWQLFIDDTGWLRACTGCDDDQSGLTNEINGGSTISASGYGLSGEHWTKTCTNHVFSTLFEMRLVYIGW